MSKWVEHVKNYAIDNKMTYREALKESRKSYYELKGGSAKSSGYIRRLIAEKNNNFDISKIKKPSNNLLEKFKKNVKKEENYDDVSMEVQRLIYITSIDDIKKVLRKLNFKGSIQTNKIFLVMQILQNFNNIDDLIEIKNMLKEVNK